MKTLFCIFLTMFSFAATAHAEAVADKGWYNSTQKEFVVSTASQLRGLSVLVAEGKGFDGKTVYLHADIDLGQEAWEPIGTASHPFMGTFDGNGYCVKIGKVIPTSYGGLFGIVNASWIKSVNVSLQGDLSGVETLGAVAGYVDKATTVSFCTGSGSVSVTGAKVVGGIVGESDGTIESCLNTCKIMSASSYGNVVGGIVGITSGKVSRCANVASLRGSNVCGGLVGQGSEANSKVNIADSHNSGKVVAISGTDSKTLVMAGGLGGNVGNAVVAMSWNNGAVSSYCYTDSVGQKECKSYAGGLFGSGSGNIFNSYNVGNVSSRVLSNLPDPIESISKAYAGGMVGYLTGKSLSAFSYCYTAGNVYGYGEAQNKSSINYGNVLGDFDAFQPSMKCCYCLEDVYKAEKGKNGVVDLLFKNIGMDVTAEKLSSVDFVYSSEPTYNMNAQEAFAYDEARVNHGFPVCPQVLTYGMKREAGNKATLRGFTNTTNVQKGFRYWFGGLEEFAVEEPANSDFEAVVEMPKKGEDCYIQAYVVLGDGSVKKGDILKVHIPNI